mmetsp:Transcript_5498/g.16393  ORF Transcript_5498/g.16393 Transcript_5498/m.16393 type:complete len:477 (+) Transcript_5498:52-1482(+)
MGKETMEERAASERTRLLRRRTAARRQLMSAADEARNGSVLGTVMNRPSTGGDAGDYFRRHSWLYLVLDSKSRIPEAQTYKYIITATAIVNLVVFVLATDDNIAARLDVLLFWVEAISSVMFLVDYICRIAVITEHRHFHGAWRGRLKYICTPSAVVDGVSALPFFIELIVNMDLPLTTPLRCLRLSRILKTEAIGRATSSVWRVIAFNRDILVVAGIVASVLTIVTATLLYYLQPRNVDTPAFDSIPATIFMAILMLTGQGGPDGDLPWYTKLVVLMTACFSVAMFAIPASMLTWGFEAEAERLARKARETRKRQKRRNCSSSSRAERISSESDDDFGTWGLFDRRNSREWREYEDVILGSDEESESERTGPISGDEIGQLIRLKSLLQHDIDKLDGSNVDKIEALANRTRADVSRQWSACDETGLQEVRQQMAFITQELRALRHDVQQLMRGGREMAEQRPAQDVCIGFEESEI